MHIPILFRAFIEVFIRRSHNIVAKADELHFLRLTSRCCTDAYSPQLIDRFLDTDTLWVRPLDRNIRAFDAVGTYDWPYWSHPFPEVINFGVLIGKRNAPYWHKFQVGDGIFNR